MKKFILNSGLPRAGSTLLQNILHQNPKIHSTETSGLFDILFNLRNYWPNLIEHKAHPCPERLQNVLKATLNAYFDDINRPIVSVKSRAFLPYIEFMENIIGEKVKILVPIRPIPDILASFEMLYRETAKVKPPPGERDNYFLFQTVLGRCKYWMNIEQPVGLALNRVDDVMRRGLGDRLFLVDYIALTSNPKETLDKIYDFIEEEPFEHDFNNIEQVTFEDDELHGFINLHKIRNKVEPYKSRAKEILGEDIVKMFEKQ